MTHEDKIILFKELCTRLPYGVKVRHGEYGGPIKLWSIGIIYCGIYYNNGLRNDSYELERIKPYLRPMSSMTEDEKKELEDICVINYSQPPTTKVVGL